MPTLTFADGSTLVWDLTSPAVQSAPTMGEPSSMVVTPPESIPPLDTSTSGSPSTPPPVTPADVQVALSKVPPKWTATAYRFAKTLAAGLAAAFGVAWATTGGSIQGVLGDPQTFLVALATALVMAIQKFATWKA